MDSLNTRWLAAAALLLSLLWAHAPAKDERVELLLTGNNHLILPILSEWPQEEKPDELLEERLLEEKAAHPEAYLFETGGHVSVGVVGETAYGMHSTQFFEKLDYDVLNLSSRDFAFASTLFNGYRFPHAPLLDRLIGPLESTYSEPHRKPAALRVAGEGRPSVTVASVGSPRAVSALSGMMPMLQQPAATELRLALDKGRQEGDFIVVISDAPEAERAELLGNRAVDLLIDHTLPAETEPQSLGQGWQIPAPARGTVVYLALERDGEGRISTPEMRVERFLEDEDFSLALENQTPQIGLALPNLKEVAPTFLGVEAVDIRIDKADVPGLEALTAVQRPVIYQFMHEGVALRAYRIRREMPDRRFDNIINTPWPLMDAIVLLRAEDHEFHRISSRLGLPIMGLETSVLDAINKMKGEPLAEWEPDPVLAAGAVEVWQWAAGAIGLAQQLDIKLYGPNGVYTSNPADP